MSAFFGHFFCVGCLLLIAFAIGKISTRRDRKVCKKAVIISKRRLFFAVNMRNIILIISLNAVFALLFALVYITGRMRFTSILIAWGVCFIYVLASIMPVFYLQNYAWKMLRRIPEFETLTQGKHLEFCNGDWYYSDRNLLICTGRYSACVLYAPMIDFSKEMRIETGSWKHVKHTTNFTRIIISLMDGSVSKQMLPYNQTTENWFRSKGARIANWPERR